LDKILKLLGALLVCAAAACAQTTEGLIAGRIADSISGRPVADSTVACFNAATNTLVTARTDPAGVYYLPLLPPGSYRVRATAAGYQTQELQDLELAVAGRIEIDFRLRPLNDIWEAGEYRSYFLPGEKTIIPFFGPDLDESHSLLLEAKRAREGTLEATLSTVVDPAQLENLPLQGRDTYSLLVTLAAVTSDGGTARGLGLSIAGQRPTASNFLLDGLENNNYLITGPLTTIAPETVQEYRVSTANYSAEYGRTSGFIANAVTRSGGSIWHGIAYFYFKNEALNANNFQRNLAGLPRSRNREFQPGGQVGGPLIRDRLFVSAAFEYFHGANQNDPQTFFAPAPQLINFVAPSSLAHQLLQSFPTPATLNPPACARNNLDACRSPITVTQPITLDRIFGLARADYVSAGGRRITGRVAVNRITRPDFIGAPYTQFSSPLEEPNVSAVLSFVTNAGANLTNEAKGGFSTDDLRWDRAHPEIPTLMSNDLTLLPGAPAIFPFRNRTRNWEFLDNLTWTRRRHIFKAGAGALLRDIDGYLAAQRDGLYLFNDLQAFAADRPQFVEASLVRQPLGTRAVTTEPDFSRQYHYNQYYLFAQDTCRASDRLTFNYGLRYELFGAPRNVGATKDAVLTLGSGSTLQQRLASATFQFPTGGSPQVFQPDNRDWGVRSGFSLDVFGNSSTVLRGGFGIFYDRPFDNLWQTLRNNNIAFYSQSGLPAGVNYLNPVRQVLSAFPFLSQTSVPSVTLIQPGLRNGYAQDFFLGLQRRITENFSLEVNGLATLGRRLLSNDLFNRSLAQRSIPAVFAQVIYRGNQDTSDYTALAAKARYRSRRGELQAAYTWSHTIDNQSDALGLDLFDFGFLNAPPTPGVGGAFAPGFSQQFNSSADRGNSDFDQRHNLVLFGVLNLPAPVQQSLWNAMLRDWTVSVLAAFRSGFPYSVYSNGISRAYLLKLTPGISTPVPGGVLLLDRSAFSAQPVSGAEMTGRNAFRGPGLYSADLSLARSVPLRWLGESGRVGFRVDAYNVLNHTNLGNPTSYLFSTNFGVATFGRSGRQASFPSLNPLNDLSRQVQLSLRVQF
jgi:Carboxypeptidase regulatory-like domain/TonB-dependent Receptor Plug Domain